MYKSIIDEIEAIDYDKYANVSSNEKLAIYASYVLKLKKIPLTFNYICIACFKLFPDKFYFDEEFKEYPHIEKLNRTILHLHTNKNSKLLVGSAKSGYEMTKAGEIVAVQVEADIFNSTGNTTNVKNKIVDSHKKGIIQDYNKLINSEYYRSKTFEEMDFDLDFVWGFFQVIPFTNLKYIEEYFLEIKRYSQIINDESCKMFCNLALSKLKF